MEHRWNVRKPVEGDVLIESPRIGKVRAVMRNISVGGMCVETVSTTLPLNAPVMVGFRLPMTGRDGGYHLEAMIVRRNGRSAGLMFLNLAFGTLGCLRERLEAATSESTIGQTPIAVESERLSR